MHAPQIGLIFESFLDKFALHRNRKLVLRDETLTSAPAVDNRSLTEQAFKPPSLHRAEVERVA